MPEIGWTAFDRFVADRVLGPDPILDGVIGANAEAGLRAIDVSAPQSRLLELLVRMTGARHVLEIGTLGGYSAIAMTRGLPPDGRLVTLELDPRHAEVGARHFARAGVADQVELRLGAAIDSLAALVASGAPPFDLIFIDPDKPGYPAYLEAAIQLSRPGTTIVLDNVVREGRVGDPLDLEPNAVGARMALQSIGADPRLRATVIQTVGEKGHDGFALAVVL